MNIALMVIQRAMSKVKAGLRNLRDLPNTKMWPSEPSYSFKKKSQDCDVAAIDIEIYLYFIPCISFYRHVS
jgi:hypothetical protein